MGARAGAGTRARLPLSLGLGLLATALVVVVQTTRQGTRGAETMSLRRAAQLDAEPFVSATNDVVVEEAPKTTTTTTTTTATATTATATTTQPPHMSQNVHVVITSNGNRYMNWQTRILYRSFLRMQKAPHSSLAAFTRILHRTSDDELMHEIPTMRFEPLQPDCDVWCSYPVADRADAIQRWLDTDDAKRYEYVLVGETDYIFMRPLTVHNLPPATSLGFPFTYIVPAHESVRDIVRKHVDARYDLSEVPQTGNAPQLLRVSDLAKVVPRWVEKTSAIDVDGAARDKLGWVREMYAYSIASLEAGLSHDLLLPPRNRLMVQPPADEALGDACFAHYTWGAFVHKDGAKVWSWDKREYGNGQYGNEPARLVEIPPMPPFDDSFVTQDKVPWTRGKYELYEEFTKHFNLAVRDANAANGGVPLGFATWSAAAAAAEPSARAREARRSVELAQG